IGDSFLSAPLFLLSLELHIASACAVPLLRVMDGAGEICAHFVDRAHVAAFGNDGFGRVLARLELGTLGLVLRLRLFVADRGVLVTGQNRAAFLLLPVG